MRQRDGRTVDLDGADVVAAALFTPLALTAGLSPLRTADWRLLGGGVPDPAQITARFGPGAARRVDDLLRRRAEVESDLAALARRGIHVVTVAHGRYPQRLLERLGDRAPAALFVAGDAALLSARGVAVVGSRDVDADGARSAAVIGRLAAKDHLTVFSGGARGVDRIAMSAALECDGSAVGVVAGAMDRGMQSLETRRLTQSGRLALVCPFLPSSPVNSATALGRNRLIYALAGKAVVVSSSADGGGTRRGALEALRHGWSGVFALTGAGIGTGNSDLIAHGAIPLASDELEGARPLSDVLAVRASEHRKRLL